MTLAGRNLIALRIYTELAVINARHRMHKPHIVIVSSDTYTCSRVRDVIPVQAAVLEWHLLAEELCGGGTPPDCDCLLLDLRLMDMSGLALFQRLKSLCSSLSLSMPPTILLADTSESDSQAVVALKAGVSDYIEKPFTAHRLVAALRTAMPHNTPQA